MHTLLGKVSETVLLRLPVCVQTVDLGEVWRSMGEGKPTDLVEPTLVGEDGDVPIVTGTAYSVSYRVSIFLPSAGPQR